MMSLAQNNDEKMLLHSQNHESDTGSVFTIRGTEERCGSPTDEYGDHTS